LNPSGHSNTNQCHKQKQDDTHSQEKQHLVVKIKPIKRESLKEQEKQKYAETDSCKYLKFFVDALIQMS